MRVFILSVFAFCLSLSAFAQPAVINKATSDSTFKKWLADTLVVLKKIDYSSIPYLTLATYHPEDDSLSFRHEMMYYIELKNGSKYSAKGKDILDLLEEYDELPPYGSAVSFSEVYYYYPSVIERLRYAFVYEWEDITVYDRYGMVSKNDKIEYDYIRGRLSHKKVYKDGKVVEEYDFNWPNDKLVKVKIK